MQNRESEFQDFLEYKNRGSGGDMLIGIILLFILIVVCMIPFVIGVLFAVLGWFRRWKPWWLLVGGLALIAIAIPLSFLTLYWEGLTFLFDQTVAGMHAGDAVAGFTGAFLDAALMMIPASIGGSAFIGGIFLWLAMNRPELLSLPVRPTQQAEEKPVNIKKLTKLPDIADGVNLGLDDFGKPVSLRDEEANMHVFVSGATGAGKTNTLSVVLESAIRRQKPVIVVDGKGDPSFLQELKEMSEAYGRKFQGFSYTGTVRYNPFRHGNATELKDKMMGMEEWSEPYYQRAAERYLQMVFRVMQLGNQRIDLQTVQHHMVPKNLMHAVKKLNIDRDEANKMKDYINGLDKGHLNAIDGLTDRLAILNESDVGPLFIDEDGAEVIDLLEAIDDNRVVMMSLSGLSYSSFTPALGKMIVEDLKSVASAIGARGRGDYIYLIMDEFNLFAGEQVVNMINKSRSAGFCCFIATQELADLSAAGDDELVGQVIGNTNVKIIHRQDVPDSAEYLANVVGTHKVLDSTVMTETGVLGKIGTSKGAVKEVEDYIVHPNVLKTLRQGQAVVIKKIPDGTVTRTQIRPAPKIPKKQAAM